MSATNTPKLLCRYVATAIQRKLQLADHQVRVDAAPWVDPAWRDFPVFQVVPGASRPEGPGGRQAGGGLHRRQFLSAWGYYRLMLDEYQTAQEILTRDAEGMLDYSEQIRALFELTMFGDGENLDSFLLTEPLRWEGETEPVVVDPDQGIVRRGLTLSGPYAIAQPTEESVTLADVL